MRAVAAAFAPGADLVQFFLQCAHSADFMWNGGNQYSGDVAWLSFFRHIARLSLDYSKWQHYEAACVHGGPRIMHAEFCIVSDRPVVLKVDAQNRPHCEDGPFCAWRDGTALWAWRGVRVPAWVITNPEHITAQRIQREENAELRRVLLERYGFDRYLTDAGAQLQHEDEFGRLYRAAIPGDEDLVVVRVVNSTPEPDGSFKHYALRVDPSCRPLLGNGQFGDPQPLTARNAVASTFGLRGEQYAPAVET